MVDLQSSVSDLISLYPIVQRMQAAALALHLQRADIPRIHDYLVQTEGVVAASSLVDESARNALAEGKNDIEDATRIIETSNDQARVRQAIEARAEITAYRVLSLRNFASAWLRAIQNGTIEGTEEGVKGVVSGGIKAAWAVLSAAIGGPVLGIAQYVGSLRPFASRLEAVKPASNRDTEKDEP